MIFDYLYNIISRGSGFLVKWLLNVVFSTLLLTSDYGIYTYYMSVAYIITSLLLFGFEIFILNKSRNKDDNGEINFYLIQTVYIVLLISLIIFPFSQSLSILVLSISISQLFIVYSKALNNFKLETKGSFISIFIICLLMFLANTYASSFEIKLKLSLIIAATSILVCSVPSMMLFYSESKKLGSQSSLRPQLNIFNQYNERKAYGFHELASVANQHIFVIICASVLSFSDLGVYKIGQLYLTPLMLIPASMSQVLLKRLKGSSNSNKTFYVIITLAFSLFIAALLLLPVVKKFLWVGVNEDVVYVYVLYALTLSVQIINVYVGSRLTIINCQKERAKNSLISFSFTVVSVLVLSINYGIVGVSVSLLMNYLLLMGLNCYSYEKNKHMYVRT